MIRICSTNGTAVHVVETAVQAVQQLPRETTVLGAKWLTGSIYIGDALDCGRTEKFCITAVHGPHTNGLDETDHNSSD